MELKITKDNWKQAAKFAGMTQKELGVWLRYHKWPDNELCMDSGGRITGTFWSDGRLTEDVAEFDAWCFVNTVAEEEIIYRKNHIDVGCQKIPIDKVKAILKEHKRRYPNKK